MGQRVTSGHEVKVRGIAIAGSFCNLLHFDITIRTRADAPRANDAAGGPGWVGVWVCVCGGVLYMWFERV